MKTKDTFINSKLLFSFILILTIFNVNNISVNAQTTILQEGFENSTFPPTGWTQEYVSSLRSWQRVTAGPYSNPSGAHGGSYLACFNTASTPQPKTTKLCTPSMDLSGASSATLTFWHIQYPYNGSYDELKVYYKTSSGGSWTQIIHYNTSVNSWTQRTITLSNLTSTYYIAFEGWAWEQLDGSCIDDILVIKIPACSPSAPTFAAKVNGTTGSPQYYTINSSLSLSSNQSGGDNCSSSWVYAWYDGSKYWNGSSFNSNTISYNASYQTLNNISLTASKTYTAYVQASGGGGSANSSITVNACQAPTLTAKANNVAISATISSGDDVTLTSNPSGGSSCSGSFEYAWYNGSLYWNGSAFASASIVYGAYSTVNLSNVTTGATFTTYCRCTTLNDCASTSSSVIVNIGVCSGPTLTAKANGTAVSIIVDSGTNITLTSNSAGDGQYCNNNIWTYAWTNDGGNNYWNGSAFVPGEIWDASYSSIQFDNITTNTTFITKAKCVASSSCISQSQVDVYITGSCFTPSLTAKANGNSGNTTIASGSDVTLSISKAGTGGACSGSFQYGWFDGTYYWNGTSFSSLSEVWFDNFNDVASILVSNISAQVTYTAKVKCSGDAACNNFSIVTIYIGVCNAPLLAAKANGTTGSIIVASGSIVTLTSNPGTGQYCSGTFTYAWYDGYYYWNGSDFSSETEVWDPTFTTLLYEVTAARTFVAKVKCSDDASCNKQSNVTVNVGDCSSPVLTAKANGSSGSLTIDSGTNVNLTANPSGGNYCNGTWEYSWYDGVNYWNGSDFSSVTETFNIAWSSINYSPALSKRYKVRVRCSFNTSCISQSTVDVLVTVLTRIFYENFSNGTNGWSLGSACAYPSGYTFCNNWGISDQYTSGHPEYTINSGDPNLQVYFTQTYQTPYTRYTDYNSEYATSDIIASKTVNASGYSNLILKFNWMAKAEFDGSTYFDYGQVGYNAGSWNWMNAISGSTGHGDNNTGKYCTPQGTVAPVVAATIPLPSACNNTSFSLGFKFHQDAATGYRPPFIIDDIEIYAPVTQSLCNIAGGNAIFTGLNCGGNWIPDGSSANLSLSGNESGSTIQWQKSSNGYSGWTTVGSSNPQSTGALTTGTWYFRAAVTKSCTVYSNIISLQSGGSPPAFLTDEMESTDGWVCTRSVAGAGEIYWVWTSQCDNIDGSRCLTLYNDLTPVGLGEGCGYVNFSGTDMFASRRIDATNYQNLSYQFDWICDGSYYYHDNHYDYDYFTIGYTTDDPPTQYSSFTWFNNEGPYGNGRFYDRTSSQNETVSLNGLGLDNSVFYLVFRWRSSSDYRHLPGITIDNLKVNGECTAYTCVPPSLTAKANGSSGSTNICSGSSVALSGNSTGGSVCSGSWVYAWSNGTNWWNGTTFASATEVWNAAYENINLTNVTATKTYTIKVKCSADATCTTQNSVSVTVYSNVVSDYRPEDQVIYTCNGNFLNRLISGQTSGSCVGYPWGAEHNITIYPCDADKKVQIDFSCFQVASDLNGPSDPKHYVSIYNGNSITAPLIGKYWGNTSPGVVTSSATDGSLYIVFHANALILGCTDCNGWTSAISCTYIAPPSNLTAAIGIPANGAEHHISVNWTSIIGADSYELQYSNNNVDWLTIYSGTAIIYDHNAGDNPNIPCYYRIRSKIGSNAGNWNSLTTPVYTACDVPNVPVVANNGLGNSLNISIASDNNPVITTYSLYNTTLGKYVQADGSHGTNPVWRTKSAWGTIALSGLTASTQYCFYAQAKNYDGDIRFSAATSLLSNDFTVDNIVHGTNPSSNSIWFAPNYNTPIDYVSSGGNPGAYAGYSGNWTNYWGNFLRFPEVNATGQNQITYSFQLSHSYFSSQTTSDWIRFYSWKDGGYKHDVKSIKINGIENIQQNVGGNSQGFYFTELRTWANIEVTEDLTTTSDKSNVLLYIEANNGYNNSNTYYIKIDNINVFYYTDVACATTSADLTCVLLNTGGTQQLAFNNSYINDLTPVFRLTGSSATGSFNKVKFEINTSATFSGGNAYTQQFSGAYSSGSQYNYEFTNAIPSTSDITYYVRAAISKDNGSNWGNWTTGTYSFTYKSSGNVDWYQTTKPQFDTDLLSGATTPGDYVLGAFGSLIFQTDNQIYNYNNCANDATGYGFYQGNDLYLGYANGYNWTTGVRLVNVTIPKSTTIGSAFIKFHSFSLSNPSTASAGNPVLRIYGENNNSPAEFSSGSKPSLRSKTSNFVNWTPEYWDKNNWYFSSDITELVQARVNDAGWVSGNPMAFIINTTSSNGNYRISEYWGNFNQPLLYVYAPASTSTLTTTSIYLSSYYGYDNWDKIKWNQTLNGAGSITLKIQKYESGVWSDMIGFTAIKATGDGDKEYDISSIGGSVGEIRIIASFGGGSAASLNSLTVTAKQACAPFITQQPAGTNKCVGQSVTFSVGSTGTPPFNYQWKRGNDIIDDATLSSFSINTLTIEDAGDYTCIVANGCGSATSDIATLSVNTPPLTTVATEATGVDLTEFTANWNSSAGAISYFIDVSKVDYFSPMIPGYDNLDVGDVLFKEITGLTEKTNYYYRIRAYNECGTSENSNTIHIKTLSSCPTAVITEHPATLNKCVGEDAFFSVTATDNGPFTYQWYKLNKEIADATNSIYNINSVSKEDMSEYYCVITNVCGGETSNSATLSIRNFEIQFHPYDAITHNGGTVNFNISVTGTDLTYQWQEYNGSAWNDISNGGSDPSYSGAASVKLILTGAILSMNNYLYRCIVHSSACSNSQTSNTASLTVNETASSGLWTGLTNDRWEVASNWDDNNVPTILSNVVIPPYAPNQPVVYNSVIARCNNADILPLASLTVKSGGKLTIAGDLSIKSDESGTGAFLDNDGAILNIIGYTNVERYIKNNGYHYFGSPLNNSNLYEINDDVSLVNLNGKYYNPLYPPKPSSMPNIWMIDEAHTFNVNVDQNAWLAPSGFEYIMQPARGYALIVPDNNITIDISGPGSTLNRGNISYNVTKTAVNTIDGTTAGNGYHLVSNPYPSPIDWDLVEESLNKISSTICFFYGTSFYYGAWGYYNPWIGGSGSFPHNQYIPSMQGFYVNSNFTEQLTFNNSFRTVVSDAMSTNFYKKSSDKKVQYPLLRLNAYPELTPVSKDETVIYFITGSSDIYDASYDGLKMMNTMPEIPNIFSYCFEDTELAINALPLVYDKLVVQLGFSASKAGKYLFNASEIINFDSSVQIYLIDSLTGTHQNLNINPVYSFNYVPDNDVNRFFIKFTEINTGTNKYNKSEIFKAYSNNNKVFVHYYNPESFAGELTIYNLEGKIILEPVSIKNGLYIYELNKAPGIYFIKMVSLKDVYINKIFIK